MKKEEFQVWQTAWPRKFSHEGEKIEPPADWVFVPAGDPGLTRRLKAAGDFWVVVHRRKNRVEALGIWTHCASVERIQKQLELERSDPAYQRKLDAARKTRECKEERYTAEFHYAVLKFLAFPPRYAALARALADAVTSHAVPVGSGTVARTERIPLEERAERAVIAWMRHRTTGYDDMKIAKVRGERREVRRELGARSRQLLAGYRQGVEVDASRCPLAIALSRRSAS
ncbi:MAG: DUF2293 domain-containing protein [Victivallaceae bacterium]|nr:DUF2293 domain-containing protein [Victivallaceae bacterium]